MKKSLRFTLALLLAAMLWAFCAPALSQDAAPAANPVDPHQLGLPGYLAWLKGAPPLPMPRYAHVTSPSGSPSLPDYIRVIPNPTAPGRLTSLPGATVPLSGPAQPTPTAPPAAEPTPQRFYSLDQARSEMIAAIDGYWDDTLFGNFAEDYKRVFLLTPDEDLLLHAEPFGGSQIDQQTLDLLVYRINYILGNPSATSEPSD